MQRVFDLSIEKEQRDLFDLLPDDTIAVCKDYTGVYIIRKNLPRIKIENCLNVICKNEKIHFYINRPENPKDWIGKLCRFWDEEDCTRLGTLKDISSAGLFMIGETGLYYDHCCPVKREEIEFVK